MYRFLELDLQQEMDCPGRQLALWSLPAKLSLRKLLVCSAEADYQVMVRIKIPPERQ